MESLFLKKWTVFVCAGAVLTLAFASVSMAESASAVLAAYLDPYGEGTVTVNDCAITITTAENRIGEDIYSEMIAVVCAARSQTPAAQGRWQNIKEIYIVNRHGEGRLFKGGDQQCEELNQFEMPDTLKQQHYILAKTETVSAMGDRTDGRCSKGQFQSKTKLKG